MKMDTIEDLLKEKRKEMNDYLITVLSMGIINSVPVFEERLIEVSKDYANGYFDAVKKQYPNNQVYINQIL